MEKNSKSGAEILRQKAEELLKKKLLKSGSAVSESDVLKLIHELEVHQIELEIQNQELLLAKEQAEVAADKYRKLYDFAPSGYLKLTREGRIVELNLQAARMLAKERSGLKGRLLGHLLSGKSRSTFNLFLDNLFACKRTESCELTITSVDGTHTYLYLSGTVEDNCEQCQLSIVDITARIKAETESLKSEQHYRMLFDSIDEGFCIIEVIFDKDEKPIDYRFIEINPSFEQQTGLINAKGKRMRDLAPEHEEHWFEIYGKIALTGEPRRFENQAKQLNRYYDVYAFRYGKPEEHLVAILFNDISVQKKIEDSLIESNTVLNLALETNHTGVWSLNLQDGSSNRTLIHDQIFGYETLLHTWSFDMFLEHVHPEDRLKVDESFREALIKSTVWSFECRILRADGKVRWIFAKGGHEKNPEGKSVRLIGLVQDITDRKLAEQQLNVSLTKYEMLFDLLPIGITISDSNGGIIETNKIAEKFLGLSPDEQEKRNIGGPEWQIIRTDGIPMPASEYASIRALKESRLVENVEMGIVKNDGQVTWLNVSAVPVPLEGYGVAIVYNNISERKKAEQKMSEHEMILSIENQKYEVLNEELRLTNDELYIAKEHAEESDRLKTAFLNNISHEIRTPMNGIIGFASLLKEPHLTGEEQQKYIRIIEKSGVRLLNTINDIVEISKIATGQIEVTASVINVNEKLRDIYSSFQGEAEEKGLKFLLVNQSQSEIANVICDKDKIYSILFHLVGNAIKYTNTGSVELGCILKGKFLEFLIKDTGIGIDKEQQEVIFKWFRHVSELDNRGYQGAGLGLSISKAYIEILGGKIWVESEIGKGSTFYFTIPYKPVVGINDVTNSAFITGEVNLLKEIKILIAEDDETSSAFMSMALKTFAKEIVKARTGIEAVEVCKNNPDIDLILMDIKMPELNGYEATRQIRKFNKDVVIIAQTAFGQPSDKENLISAGCNGYISKPFDQELLISLIKMHVSRQNTKKGRSGK